MNRFGFIKRAIASVGALIALPIATKAATANTPRLDRFIEMLNDLGIKAEKFDNEKYQGIRVHEPKWSRIKSGVKYPNGKLWYCKELVYCWCPSFLGVDIPSFTVRGILRRIEYNWGFESEVPYLTVKEAMSLPSGSEVKAQGTYKETSYCKV